MPYGASSLAISRITVHPTRIPLKSPFKIATMTASEAPNVFVKVETASGLVGWGEASFMQSINGETQGTVAAALQALGPLVLGEDPRETRRLFALCARALPGQAAARCALDTALNDLAAQAAGVPLFRHLGGGKRPLATDMTISAVGPDAAREAAADLAASGYRIIKLKIGTTLEEDRARFEAVKEGAPRAIIRLDANQGYTRLAAHQAFSGGAFEGAEFCEQPLARADLEGMAWLSGFSRVPLMADESVFGASDVAAIHLRQACPLINTKISKAGGVTGALECGEAAAACGLTSMMGGMMETRLGVTASTHAALARGVFQHFDLDAHKDHAIDPIAGGIWHEQGMVELGEVPGLGASPDPAWLSGFESLVIE